MATFFKYVGISYNFGKLAKEEYPTAEETLSLYNAILRGLNDRRSVKEHMPRPNNHHRDLYNRWFVNIYLLINFRKYLKNIDFYKLRKQ